MNALVENHAAPLARLQSQIAEIEGKLHPLVTKMLDEGMELSSSRDQSRVVLSGLTYAKYLRDVAHGAQVASTNDADLTEDDLIALPKGDVEKIVKLGARILGKERARELTG